MCVSDSISCFNKERQSITSYLWLRPVNPQFTIAKMCINFHGTVAFPEILKWEQISSKNQPGGSKITDSTVTGSRTVGYHGQCIESIPVQHYWCLDSIYGIFQAALDKVILRLNRMLTYWDNVIVFEDPKQKHDLR